MANAWQMRSEIVAAAPLLFSLDAPQAMGR